MKIQPTFVFELLIAIIALPIILLVMLFGYEVTITVNKKEN